ncbi:DUF948 domain-containing protein [Pseudalkalibacillus sp. R45]|uniref:DUF948 domain-containing protein n=1 Tax=Pseudalkalibacillus sp. R45 TaxID=3457433 RepID=UPI003FCC6F56
MLVYIGILLIAVSFAVIVFYLVRILHSVNGAVNSLEHSVDQLEGQMEEITGGSKHLVKETSHIVDDIHHKLHSTSGLVQTLQHVGGLLDHANRTINRSADHFSSHANGQSKQIVKLVKWGNAAFRIYKEKNKRKEG